MARAPRKRYAAKSNKRFNDVPLEGTIFTFMGECSASGMTKKPNGAALYKSDRTHYLLRLEDKKGLRKLGLKDLKDNKFVVAKNHLGFFYTELS